MINTTTIGQITLNDRPINYTLKNSRRARRLRLAIHCDGTLVVTKPFFLRAHLAEEFIREKAEWILTKLDYYKKFPRMFPEAESPAAYAENKEKAQRLIAERLKYFNEFYKFQYAAVRVRNQKTRWGSCSRRGNLSFNYRLAFLPPEVADYVIVHELCHLREFNHSARFWEQVARTLPNYAARRRALKGRYL